MLIIKSISIILLTQYIIILKLLSNNLKKTNIKKINIK